LHFALPYGKVKNMKLKEYLELKNESPTVFANRHGFPVPVITRFLNGQRSLSLRTAGLIVRYTAGEVGFEDLVPEDKPEKSDEALPNMSSP
jgi:hypothetical protein